MKKIVAIDGPAGAGKSTVARRLADALGFVLLDTGALYRTVALAAKRQGVAWDNDAACAEVARGCEIRLETGKVFLGGEDVSTAIREPDISMGASRVSAIGGVRDALMDLQRRCADELGVVAEGRDIGTVVFPDAPAKFFLTASLEIRAQRRLSELQAKGEDVDLETMKQQVAQRDKQDSEREVAPLKQADDAVLVDSSGRSVDDIVAEMQRVVEDALA